MRADARLLDGVAISTWEPFQLLPAPIYVFLQKNEKFLSVKGPLDYFTPEDLQKFKEYELFFIPNTVASLEPIYQIARAVRRLLEWNEKQLKLGQLGLSDYELSDSLLAAVSPIWVKCQEISPFVVTLWVDHLLGPLDPAFLDKSRELDQNHFEVAIHRASWVVFCLIHLGYSNLDFLKSIWIELITLGSDIHSSLRRQTHEVSQIIQSAIELITTPDAPSIPIHYFEQNSDRFSIRFSSRLKRAQSDFSQNGLDSIIPDILFGGVAA